MLRVSVHYTTLEEPLLIWIAGVLFFMNTKRFCNTACLLATLSLAGTAAAQNTSKFAFNVGGGFTEPIGPSARRADTGFNVTAGGGINFAPSFGISAEFGYNRLDLSNGVLTSVGVPGGNAHIYSVTLEPTYHLNPHGRFGAYLIGGGGFYRRTIDFTAPTVSTITLFDPFLGVIYPAAVPATQVLASFTQNKGGLNVGAGVEIRVKGDSNAK